VSPFKSKRRSIASCVTLIREGKCALATSFAEYKFVITYGQLFSSIKVLCLYLGVIMSSACYITIDMGITLTMAWCATFSKPRDSLEDTVPTTSLLGYRTVGSVMGVHIIHLSAIFIGLSIMRGHSDFVRWPTEYVNMDDSWFLADS